MNRSAHRPARTALGRALLTLSALCASLMVSAPSLASERWFQVELIAFVRDSADSGQEHWPQSVALRYPARWQTLKDPSQLEPATDPQTPGSTDNPNLPDWNQVPAPGEVVAPNLETDPFYQLPESELTLRRHANALRRDTRYRVLMHQAWRQPVLDQQSAPALLIAAGDSYGSHTELEGSVQLHLGRFLHLQADLWWSEFEVNYGQRPDAWPILPQRPERLAQTAAEQHLVAGETSPFADLNLDLGAAGAFTGLGGDNTLPAVGDLPSSLGEPYLPKRIYTLSQSRRMRSGELHYIDHPRLGLIVQVTPYPPPAP